MLAVVFDTESGLVKNTGIRIEEQPRIIEFYGCLIDTDKPGEILHEVGFLCNPGAPIEPIVSKITHITDEMVENERPFSDYIQDVALLFSKAEAAVAHNMSHDQNVIEIEQKRYAPLGKFPWPERMICTVEQTIHLRGHRLRLADLYMLLFNEGFEGAHRAKQDTAALARAFTRLVQLETI